MFSVQRCEVNRRNMYSELLNRFDISPAISVLKCFKNVSFYSDLVSYLGY
jgi:hypothetical protein